MWEAIRYEFSMMDWKKSIQVFLPILLIFGSWVYVPIRQARYRANRKRFEQTFDSVVTGQVLFVRKLHQPAGDDGRIRILGYEVHFITTIEGEVIEKEQYIPKTVYPSLNQQIRRWMNGDTKALVRYQTGDPHRNTLQLVDFVY